MSNANRESLKDHQEDILEFKINNMKFKANWKWEDKTQRERRYLQKKCLINDLSKIYKELLKLKKKKNLTLQYIIWASYQHAVYLKLTQRYMSTTFNKAGK